MKHRVPNNKLETRTNVYRWIYNGVWYCMLFDQREPIPDESWIEVVW